MSNTVPFNIPLGLNVANNLIVNSTAMVANGIVANSTGMNVATVTTSENVTANNIGPNTATHLALIANLISMNVLSGNLQTLLSLTSNQIFVNTLSGNTGVFINLTSNQIFVNSITCNAATFSNISNTTFVFNTFHIGNSTNYTDIYANGIWYTDSVGTGKIMPAETLLQKGTSINGSFATINFSNEVVSNCYSSMKLTLWYYLTSIIGTYSVVYANFSADGVNAIGGGTYIHTFLTHAEGSSSTTKFRGESNRKVPEIISHQTGHPQASNIGYKVEVIIGDTQNISQIKCIQAKSVGMWNDSNEYLAQKTTGIYYTSSIVLKGIIITLSNAAFSPLNWVLTGTRV